MSGRRTRTRAGPRTVLARSGAIVVAALASCEADDPGGAGDAGAPFAQLRGRFTRDRATEAVLAAAPGVAPFTGRPSEVASALAADLDGDGRDELVLNQCPEIANRSRGRGASWIARADAQGRWRVEAVDGGGWCRAAADLDGDGDVDLACLGATPRVLWNERGAFDPARATVVDPGGAAMSVTPRDLDADGLADLVVSNWDAGPLRVFHNLGAGRFEEVAAAWGIVRAGLTWLTASVDLDADGAEDLFAGGDGPAHENLALRRARTAPDGTPRFERFAPSTDPRVAQDFFGTSFAPPMGVTLAYLDDATPHLIVTTDFVRGPGLPVLVARTAGDWRYASGSLGLGPEVTSSGAGMIPWAPRVWDIDHDGRAEVLIPCGDDEGHAGEGPRGVSRALVYRRDARSALVDVADAVLPTAGQFQNASLSDLDGDGDLDLVLGGFGQPWEVYRNDVEPAGNHVLLRLVGRSSGADAFGARVAVSAGGATRRYIYGDHAAPQAMEHGAIDVALGPATRIDALTVRWPSGYTQVLRGIPSAPRLGVVEPDLVSVEPATRSPRARAPPPVGRAPSPWGGSRRRRRPRSPSAP